MGGPTLRREWLSPAVLADLRAQALRSGEVLAGFHHDNYRLTGPATAAVLPGWRPDAPVKVRVGRRATLQVVERPWPHEGEVLRALRAADLVPNTPEFYDGQDDVSFHEFVPGRTLADVCPPGKPVDEFHVEAIIDQMARFTRVPAAALPALPAGWAADGDTRSFLRDRADFAERRVRVPHWPGTAALFTALEVPAGALRALRDRTPALTARPFGLIHGDLHRHNIIVREDNRGLTVVDWELAMFGDPVHDLAIHLVRMRYPADQRWDVVERWRAAVGPRTARGLDQDLPVYLNYERAQSLFADTIRAAWSLDGTPAPGAVGAAVARVRNALHLAAGPLRLNRVPSRTEVERALLGWVRARQDARAADRPAA